MKLKKFLYENAKIDYIENENEAKEYLKLFDYYGKVLMHDDKKFSLGIFKLNDPFFPDDVLRLKIKECYNFEYKNTLLNSNTTYPEECYTLNIKSCDVAKGTDELKIKIICHNNFDFDLIRGASVLNIHDISKENISTFFSVERSGFDKIIYNTSKTTNIVNISDCHSICSFANLILPDKVAKLKIFGTAISSFEHFKTDVGFFKFDCRKIKNFLHSDKINAFELELSLYYTFDNIINVIINKNCNVISLTYNDSFRHNVVELIDILAKYTKMLKHKRLDHIMDCALDLIDAGFEKAAEL